MSRSRYTKNQLEFRLSFVVDEMSITCSYVNVVKFKAHKAPILMEEDEVEKREYTAHRHRHTHNQMNSIELSMKRASTNLGTMDGNYSSAKFVFLNIRNTRVCVISSFSSATFSSLFIAFFLSVPLVLRWYFAFQKTRNIYS